MLNVRPSTARGYADHGWLKSFHTFSFADFYDPRFMGFRDLRVINEDRIAPGQGFGTHPHRDMEIVSYVLDGKLEHKDSLGNGGIIRAGDFQYMSAGSGVRHSELNPSPDQGGHFLQIWIMPNETGAKPRYDQISVSDGDKANRFRLVLSPEGGEGAMAIRQDMRLYVAAVDADFAETYSLSQGRHAWVQVTKGAVIVNGKAVEAGDGIAISDEASVVIRTKGNGEVLLFDLK